MNSNPLLPMKRTIENELPLLEELRNQMVKLAYGDSYLAAEPDKASLGGWCILTSYVLFHILKRRGYHPYVCKNYIHAFIKCDDFYIDLTTKQFDNTGWSSGQTFPPIWCSKLPGYGTVHEIIDKTDKASEIWTKLCKGWNQPVQLHHPEIVKMIKML